jgi:hypothetical protein
MGAISGMEIIYHNDASAGSGDKYPDNFALMKWVETYCKAHKDVQLIEAAGQLYFSMWPGDKAEEKVGPMPPQPGEKKGEGV